MLFGDEVADAEDPRDSVRPDSVVRCGAAGFYCGITGFVSATLRGGRMHLRSAGAAGTLRGAWHYLRKRDTVAGSVLAPGRLPTVARGCGGGGRPAAELRQSRW